MSRRRVSPDNDWAALTTLPLRAMAAADAYGNGRVNLANFERHGLGPGLRVVVDTALEREQLVELFGDMLDALFEPEGEQ